MASLDEIVLYFDEWIYVWKFFMGLCIVDAQICRYILVTNVLIGLSNFRKARHINKNRNILLDGPQTTSCKEDDEVWDLLTSLTLQQLWKARCSLVF
jgi:hypothetical protein